MAEKVVHPETGEHVTKAFARDMGFLEEAEPVPEANPEPDIGQDIEDFMESQGGFEDVGQPETADFSEFEDSEFGDSEPVQDEEDFFGDGFQEQQYQNSDARPLWTNSTTPEPDETEDEPEIDKRAKDWEDRGKKYEETDRGGIRVTDG
jgi:hypothetical protein